MSLLIGKFNYLTYNMESVVRQNKLGMVFSLENAAEITKTFFTAHHGLWRKQGNEVNKKRNSGVRKYLCPRSLLQHWEPRSVLRQCAWIVWREMWKTGLASLTLFKSVGENTGITPWCAGPGSSLAPRRRSLWVVALGLSYQWWRKSSSVQTQRG
jgi:hypothetical protein